MRYLLGLVFLVGCSHPQPKPQPQPEPKPTPVAKQSCEPGDTAIATSTACLQDDAACYQIADGTWCTGGRPGGNW